MSDSSPNEKTQWHPAFRLGLKIELRRFQDILEFQEEVPLTTEPLRMDFLVIKKSSQVEIDTSIGIIFRSHNIWEYKSPDDYISVDDFKLTMAYVYLYSYINSVDLREITLSILSSREPERLFRLLTEELGYTLEEPYPGITYVHGCVIPIQILNNIELSEEFKLLRSLRKNVSVKEFTEVVNLGNTVEKSLINPFIYALLKANPELLGEEDIMNEARLNELLEEAGYVSKSRLNEGREEGREEGRIEELMTLFKEGIVESSVVIARLSQLGYSKEQAVMLLQEI